MNRFRCHLQHAMGVHRCYVTQSHVRLTKTIITHTVTPLIIRHASGLIDWICGIEKKEDINFKEPTSIGWRQVMG